MSDLKIYNNGENKVLMSAGDRIIRQPYEFGSAFLQQGNYYLQIDGLNVSLSNFSALSWFANTQGTAFIDTICTLKGGVNNYNLSLIPGNGSAQFQKNSVSFNTNLVLTRLAATSWLNTYNLVGVNIDASQGTMFISDKTQQSAVTAQLTDATFSACIIGGCITTNTNLSPQSLGRNKINRHIIFDRPITTDEYRYFYQNKIGSNLQSRVGVYIDVICSMAEILDFSILQDGSDLRVGCRDYSGFNRHAQIINLPVGSLADQLAFANANLFVPFIQ